MPTNCVERMGTSRSGHLQFLRPWRLVPIAHARLGGMKRMPKLVLLLAGGVGGAFLFYFLSLGPVLRLATDTRFEGMVDSFYAPVLDRAGLPPVRSYLRLWGLYHPIADSPDLPRAR
jgi:hypothetical protein